MQFTWNIDRSADCHLGCGGWIAAVGVVTEDTFDVFDKFIQRREVRGATVVLDSGGGSVLDAIKLGRRWRDLDLSTTVGRLVPSVSENDHPRIDPDAYCESMCVFLLLAGNKRYVPPEAHIRVHQIWMGDRADNAIAASYTAQDLMIVQRDVGRLTQYTFDMGGSGDLLALALSVPPWEPLLELTRAEMWQANVMNVHSLRDSVPGDRRLLMSRIVGKPISSRFENEDYPPSSSSAATSTAEAGIR